MHDLETIQFEVFNELSGEYEIHEEQVSQKLHDYIMQLEEDMGEVIIEVHNKDNFIKNTMPLVVNNEGVRIFNPRLQN